MKQKYCPYCDQKMTSDFYCEGCRRIVLHPYEQDVDYYLNERHPQNETDCLYHGIGEESRTAFSGTSASTSGKNWTVSDGYGKMQKNPWKETASGMRKLLDGQKSRADRQTTKNTAGTRIKNEADSRRRAGNSLKGIGLVFLIWVVLIIAQGIFAMIGGAFADLFRFLGIM